MEVDVQDEVQLEFPHIGPGSSGPSEVLHRNFSRYFLPNVKGNDMEDQYVWQHFNKLCIVGVAGKHPILTGSQAVTKVDFSQTKIKISGKKKKGAKFLAPNDPLCQVTMVDGTIYTLRSAVRGGLIEINEKLITNPNLLKTKPETDGYIAILQPNIRDKESKTTKHLTSHQDYLKLRQLES